MTDTPSEQQDTRPRHVEPHPVTALLAPKMRARVRAATFVLTRSGISAEGNGTGRRCPLAVAVGLGCSVRPWVYRALGVSQPDDTVETFMAWADSIYSDPADVYALLGCEEPAP